MEIKTYRKQDLKEFIISDFFRNLVVIPISIQRAISQINNPRASESDILLVVQYDNNKVAGYLGILPDYIFYESKKEKIGWLSCFWVADEYKSLNVAASLLLKVFSEWDEKIFITNYVPRLEELYQRTRIFRPTFIKKGYRGYLRSNLAEILPSKHNFFRKSILLLRIVDLVLNIIHDVRILATKKYKLSNVNYEYLHLLDDDSALFIDKYIQNNATRRGKEEINWILSIPWLIQGTSDYNSYRYYFSSLSKQFFYQTVKFTNINGQITSIIVLQIRDKHLTVPYLFTEDNNNIYRFLINTMIDLKLNMLTIFDEELTGCFKNRKTPFYFSKEIKRQYLLPKRFGFLSELKFQDGDGDCAFY